MQLEYSVSRTGENNEGIRTSVELKNATKVRVAAHATSCWVMYHSHDKSYSLMINEEDGLAINISSECATQLVSVLGAEINDQLQASVDDGD